MVGYWKRALAAAILVTATGVGAVAAPGTFVVVSDIHFDPFDPPDVAKSLAAAPPGTWAERFASLPPAPASQYGSDTNHVLLAATLEALAAYGATADFAIVGGDLLSHGFEDDAAKALGASAAEDFAARTAQFVAGALGAAFAGKPVIVALGNNDSGCDDYAITPGGAFLAATRDTVKALAGEAGVAGDFDRTWAAGGYYAMRHPTAPGVTILVLNDVLWSARYHDACGSGGEAAATVEMDWLDATLAAIADAGGRAMIVQHIPWGIDPYSTTHSKAPTCREKMTPFLRAEHAERLRAILAAHAATIDLSLAGHIHTDDYRLLLDAAGTAVAAQKIVPAISPIFGQNPAFQVFTHDRDLGTVSDFATIRLANLSDLGPEDADWGESYLFSKAYGFPGYTARSVAALWNGLGQGGAIRTAYRDNYNAGNGPLPEGDLAGYACAIGHLDPAGFVACWCGE